LTAYTRPWYTYFIRTGKDPEVKEQKMTIKLKKLEFGGYRTADDKFRVFNYMGVWTVVEDNDGEEIMTDFMTLAECREFISEQVAA
jgi:hypothetical protein